MNVKLLPLQKHGDDRGSLIALEEGQNVPFTVRRVYYLFETKEGVRRGFHAHKNLKQLVVAVRGSCRFLLDDGHEQIELVLDNPAQGLLVEAMVWREMYDFSEDCVLMVLADSLYDESDYIRDKAQFLALTQPESRS
ncbi:sugar 3,4-ketoisomerase [Chitinimonas sp. BJB300]|uniref:sugar 3,4-ketoisomerase n=1 Tax=Chitinimonas sp. BJB300 TaxID=1559339 RepID=UPI000C0D441E|nr:FdtA/QdtA family cupin domain-containing protein [Chitinimonas sp. BJB300]PHV11413.1 dTDP-6-deoxy-3,4-keto-hexulose isomerase [Chitinimonas sp. BJB300]TSJ91011.1 WxcM-like domain-containing protein [Chitinimonas sp. BJB300]